MLNQVIFTIVYKIVAYTEAHTVVYFSWNVAMKTQAFNLFFEVLVKYEGGSVAEWLGHCNVFSIFSYRIYKEIDSKIIKG